MPSKPTRRSLAAALLAASLGCGPAQIGSARDASKAVDALYTAVSLRDAPRVDACLATLGTLRDSGALPADAYSSLESIASRGRSGEWEGAQTRLRRFIEGQRR